ncbi:MULTISPECIES: MBL fold metallo-hydrolase [unclassified Exiguobacterium]|uniref:ComEC/Rec2 family competence protein n=1 Tax=unclassified Exiguobacterium TaxID=2644629 RepID=UPI001BE70D17|nr:MULTISPECIES: MBL fold metallo-hydrolase [unclassified Exiguobacterium]
MYVIKSLPAHDGDSFIIKFGKGTNAKNIIVDGGRRAKVVKKLKEELSIIQQANQYVDLLVVTHIDEDHIQGLIKLFEDSEIDKSIFKKVWFNSKELLSMHFMKEEQEDEQLQINYKEDNKISFTNGISFGKLIKNLNLSAPNLIHSGQELNIGEATLKVLSPNLEELEKLFKKWDKVFPAKISNGIPISSRDKEDHHKTIDELSKMEFIEDKAPANGSSIAFSIEIKGEKLLMLGDSFPSVVEGNLKKIYNDANKIPFSLIKVSHHGSKHNTSQQLLDLVSCNRYLISTNGQTHGFPHKETLVKISLSSKNDSDKTYFYFNYPNIQDKIFNLKETEFLNIKCIDADNIQNEVLEVDLWKSSEN